MTAQAKHVKVKIVMIASITSPDRIGSRSILTKAHAGLPESAKRLARCAIRRCGELLKQIERGKNRFDDRRDGDARLTFRSGHARIWVLSPRGKFGMIKHEGVTLRGDSPALAFRQS